VQERRHTPRRKSYLGGKMVFNKDRSIVDCLVRDFSDEGARIECPEVVALPQDLDLTIECKGLQASAHVIWREGTQLGLAFTAALAPRDAGDNVIPIGTAHLIAKLQAANAELRRRVSHLSEG